MMQRHTILINLNYSANTLDTAIASASTLQIINGYQANNVQGIGGGIVNPSNVRGFLNDDVNDVIINDFFSYLTGSTTTEEFGEIYRSDQKLSDVFNSYYTSSVLNNQFPSPSVLSGSLTGTTGINVFDNSMHNMDGVAPTKGLDKIPLSINNSTRIVKVFSALTTFTLEDSYYIPVFVKNNSKQMARLTFTACDKVINLLLNPPLPIAPTIVTGQQYKQPTGFKAIFSQPPGATSFKTYISSTPGGPYTLYGYSSIGIGSGSAIFIGLSPGVHYVVVTSLSPAGESEFSNEIATHLIP